MFVAGAFMFSMDAPVACRSLLCDLDEADLVVGRAGCVAEGQSAIGDADRHGAIDPTHRRCLRAAQSERAFEIQAEGVASGGGIAGHQSHTVNAIRHTDLPGEGAVALHECQRVVALIG